MKNATLLALTAVSSLVAICYGSVVMNNAGFGGYGYYPAYHTSGNSVGMFGGSGGGSEGLFGMLIHIFLFIFLIQLLFPSNGNGVLGLNN